MTTAMAAARLTSMTGNAQIMKSSKESPARVPMNMPTGLPSIVPAEPTLVAMTQMIRYGVGLSLSVSET